jgi:hypothetical protein
MRYPRDNIDEDFLQKERRYLKKWEKSSLETAAVPAVTSRTLPVENTNKQPMGSTKEPRILYENSREQLPEKDSDGNAKNKEIGNSAAALPFAAAMKSTAARLTVTAGSTTAAGSITTAGSSTAAGQSIATGQSTAAGQSMTAGQSTTATAVAPRTVIPTKYPASTSIPAKTSMATGAKKTIEKSKAAVRFKKPLWTPGASAEDPLPKPPITTLKDQSEAGPSKPPLPQIRVQHRAPTFADLDMDLDEDIPGSRKRRFQSESEDSDDSQKATQNPGNRRVAQPSGQLFDPPCKQCVKRKTECEKDAFAAACVRCYMGKNRCDYGGRYFQNPNIPKRGNRKLKSKGKGNRKFKPSATRERGEVESEDDLPKSVYERRRRPAKRVRSAAFAEETDEMMVSGYETAQPPPPSRSPSPKPRREAAKKAEIAMAAAVRSVNIQEELSKRRRDMQQKGT